MPLRLNYLQGYSNSYSKIKLSRALEGSSKIARYRNSLLRSRNSKQARSFKGERESRKEENKVSRF